MWALRRLASALLVLWAIATIVFFGIRAIPGDPAELMLSVGGTTPSAEQVAALRARLGLDAPPFQEYLRTLAGYATGDFGRSLADRTPVIDLVSQRLPRTVELVVVAGILATVAGVAAGTVAALRAGRALDRLTSAGASLALSAPVFVLGSVLIGLFAERLGWLPAGGYVPFARDPVRHLESLVLPAVTVAAGFAAVVFRMTRSAIRQSLDSAHVTAARAMGLGARTVFLHNVLRPALIPILTITALQLGTLLGGTVLVEQVFNWPGIAGLIVQSVISRDYPVVSGAVLIIAALVVLVNLLTELTYGLLDPRVRRS